MTTQKSQTIPSKAYSSHQEQLISRYLKWDLVSASGARFKPGDITCERWLGECKTHMTYLSKIQFNASEWHKICAEATSQMKTPVLFVDDGTQLIPHTWCMIPYSILPSALADKITVPFPYPYKTNIIVPSSVECDEQYFQSCLCVGSNIVCWRAKDVVVLPLMKFRSLLEEHLGC